MDHAPPEQVMLVDDDQNLLDSMVRNHRRTYNLHPANGAQEGLALLASEGPFAVVVSDFRMPGMDGITFLSRVAEEYPLTVRVMLTGNADLDSAIQAVNQGQVFRFLRKPCPPDPFRACINAALEQSRLIHAERTLLEGTLMGTVEVLSNLLALASPQAFGRAERLKQYVGHMAEKLERGARWRIETAALLSQIGWITIPATTVNKVATGGALSAEEAEMVERHPLVARDLLCKIPRLGDVAEMIGLQHTASGREGVSDRDPRVVQGGRMLRVAIAFDEQIRSGSSPENAVHELMESNGAEDQPLLRSLYDIELQEEGTVTQPLAIRDLRIGMLLDQDVLSHEGALIVASGHRITRGMIERLHNYSELGGIEEPISVRIPQRLAVPEQV